MNVNYVVIGGNLTKDVELRYTPSGTEVAGFTIAVNTERPGKDGAEPKKETAFIQCVVFGKTAVVAEKYLSKGTPALVEGRIKVETWEGQDGKRRYSTKVYVHRLHLVGSRKTDEGGKEEPEWAAPEEGNADR